MSENFSSHQAELNRPYSRDDHHANNNQKCGNSACVRIPNSLMDAAKLTLDSVVNIRVENGRIFIEPVRSAPYNLEQLLAGITAENPHGETDVGSAVGEEAF